MANSALYNSDETFTITDIVLHDIQLALRRYPTSSGHERARNLLQNPVLTYQNAKKIKSFLDQGKNAGTPAYALCGGKLMLNFINSNLSSERQEVHNKKVVRSNAGFTNQFRKTHEKTFIKPSVMKISDIKLPKPQRMELYEGEADVQPTFALVIIVNPQKEILLLKRSADDHWMPGKWGLVGGGIDDGESSMIAAKREVKEEANLVITKLIQCAKLDENEQYGVIYLGQCADDSILKVDPTEHSEFAWVGLQKISEMDGVPGLEAMIKSALLSYQNSAIQ